MYLALCSPSLVLECNPFSCCAHPAPKDGDRSRDSSLGPARAGGSCRPHWSLAGMQGARSLGWEKEAGSDRLQQ